MRCYTHQDIRRFDTDHQIVISQIFYDMHLIQRTFHNTFCRYTMVFIYQILFQRTAVYTDTDWDIPLLCHFHNSLHSVNASDIARIDADLICSVFHGSDRHLIIKMDVCHKRDMDLFFDLADRFCSLLGRNRTADDLAACLFQSVDLHYCRCHILCMCIRHGLDQHRISATDHSVTNMHYFCMITIHNYPLFIALSI